MGFPTGRPPLARHFTMLANDECRRLHSQSVIEQGDTNKNSKIVAAKPRVAARKPETFAGGLAPLKGTLEGCPYVVYRA